MNPDWLLLVPVVAFIVAMEVSNYLDRRARRRAARWYDEDGEAQ